MSLGLVHVWLSMDAPAALIHEARVMVIRRGGSCSFHEAVIEGLRLLYEGSPECSGRPVRAALGAVATTHLYLSLDLPAGLIGEAKSDPARIGGSAQA